MFYKTYTRQKSQALKEAEDTIKGGQVFIAGSAPEPCWRVMASCHTLYHVGTRWVDEANITQALMEEL